ncbi:MAG: glycosyltransferase family 9 protein [Elusimicrobiaceae bacterium]|mgnify:CR=1 FL=1|jgi:heptosyltransferase III|nr:glycosyltransferase family 9 protein [Elusimicrobiaceae bacterium]MBT3955469.1 glycosyltransferase family 9 protein [Elusimicrobiaceae bacterium]MBT4008221.1 glycosyltransferase family 9 protein [Elusimicrobiaceae bacterium]MBT4403087.1 glycosyltransferase family 9 protein [Elusimicrobiaceae bacterium]MBT4439335.1 glycosyltransferase family 9 protein [Elusimicrobiaceae bacterium]
MAKKILVIQLRRIGDALMSTPALEVLRNNFLDAKIDFLAESPTDDVVKNNPFIDEVIVYDKKHPIKQIWKIRQKKYDIIIDLLSNPRTAMLTKFSGAKVRAGNKEVSCNWGYNLKLTQDNAPKYSAHQKVWRLKNLGIKLPESLENYPMPLFKLPKGSEQFKTKTFTDLGFTKNDFIIGFAPLSRRKTREWPAEKFKELAKLLQKEFDAKIIVFWGPGEEERAKKVVEGIETFAKVSPATKNLEKLASLMQGCKLIITNCNGPKHLALSVGVKTLTVFFSSDPWNWTPKNNPNHQIIRIEDLPCIGCGNGDECKIKSLDCQKKLTPEMVLAKATEMI